MLENIDDILAMRAALRSPNGTAHEARVRDWCARNERKFDVHAAADGVLEISIMDVIGYDYWSGGGVTAKSVKAKLDANPNAKSIKVLINSPGGDVFEGIAIQALLKRTGATVDVEILGWAASAASVIAMAGDTIRMHDGSLMMIHQAWTMAMGSAGDMRQTADFLEKIDASILDIYVRRTGGNRDEIRTMVENETWMTAEEAVAAKFASSVIPGKVEGDPPASDKKKSKASAEVGALILNTPTGPIGSDVRAQIQKALNEALVASRAPAVNNSEGPTYEVGDRVFVPEPHEPGQTVGEVREAVLTYTYGIVFDGLEDEGIHHWYVESEVVPEAQRAAFEEPNEPTEQMSAGKSGVKSMSNNQPATAASSFNADELTDEEREVAAAAVAAKRDEQRQQFFDSHPFARAVKPPAPPFGGMRNR
jgi:ATP-dependent protease ClpP protease subunit